jgi:hypothetical protein
VRWTSAFSLLLPDVTTIADEVDFQLTQAMEGDTGVMATTAAAYENATITIVLCVAVPFAM